MPGKDLKKELKELYTAKAGRIVEVDVPKLDCLMVDGMGDPSRAFGDAFAALYGVAYPLKFAIKKRDPKLDYVVMPPEALYTANVDYAQVPRDEWPWTLLVVQPVKPTKAELAEAKTRAFEKGARLAPELRLGKLDEGHCVQTLHVGPYDKEQETVRAMHAYMVEHGYTFGGAHHEVYLNDPRRAGPAKTKTVLRQPVVATRVAPLVA